MFIHNPPQDNELCELLFSKTDIYGLRMVDSIAQPFISDKGKYPSTVIAERRWRKFAIASGYVTEQVVEPIITASHLMIAGI